MINLLGVLGQKYPVASKFPLSMEYKLNSSFISFPDFHKHTYYVSMRDTEKIKYRAHK